MQLDAYLERIGYSGSRAPTLDTLIAVHRAHLLTISYENLDIHLGRALTLDPAQIFAKIVTGRRGGWCYEMNGLFAWALAELGFRVTLLGSAVNRAAAGAAAENNHLILRVDLDRPYLADVGFGNGFLEPLPLQPGQYQQGFLSYRLTQDADRWFFENHAYGGAGFDFTLQPRHLPDFAERCTYLQTSPASGFVRNLVCHRHTPDGIITLRNASLRTVTASGAADQVVDNSASYEQVLNSQFNLHLPPAEVAALWEQAWAKQQT